jgi:4-hydroxybenzoate polyprenyltransferase
MLWESFLFQIKRNPLFLFALPLWLLKGRAELKAKLAEDFEFDPSVLPYRQEVLEFAEREKKRGRKVILATASHQKIAERVATHLKLFDEVLATTEESNLKGKHKAERLVSAFGKRGFAYIGDSSADQSVWAEAGEVFVVGESEIAGKGAKEVPVYVLSSEAKINPKELLRALRPHQWVKNILIFLPLVLAHELNRIDGLILAALAFVAFSFCSSSVYVLNDLLDLESDRHHHSKRRRPFARGSLSISLGIVLVPVLLGLSGIFAWQVNQAFLAVLAGYLALTFFYSVRLKQVVLVDILTLAALYTIRIIAGGAAVAVVLSEWLLGFSLFFFLSLACVKRYSELWSLRQAQKQEVKGRGYVSADLELVGQLGASAGYLSVLIMALYISSTEVSALYRSPQILWMLCPILLYWISRVWLLAHRGQLHEDPIVFAIRDGASYLTGALAALVLFLAM